MQTTRSFRAIINQLSVPLIVLFRPCILGALSEFHWVSKNIRININTNANALLSRNLPFASWITHYIKTIRLKKKRFKKSARIMSRVHEEKTNSPIRQAMSLEMSQWKKVFFIIKSRIYLSQNLFITKIVVNIRYELLQILNRHSCLRWAWKSKIPILESL